jgi:hypothetical protein
MIPQEPRNAAQSLYPFFLWYVCRWREFEKMLEPVLVHICPATPPSVVTDGMVPWLNQLADVAGGEAGATEFADTPSSSVLFVLVRPFLNLTPKTRDFYASQNTLGLTIFVYWNESQSRKAFPSLGRIIVPTNGPFR